MEYISHSAEETKKFAQEFAQKLQGGEVIALIGNLGGGKTTFTQGLAEGLGIKQRVLSPTFVLMRSYPFKKGGKSLTLYHLDLYRLEKSKEAKALGLEEIWSDPKNVVLIEWAEKIKSLLPEKTIEIRFEYLEENERKISYNPNLSLK
ncbi:MAG: tRNA (adenosine(37)-N6)-threonylcarbamoyltransferase complex ATPase subunit type 1 TsaE [Patescibacteria group bacterium]|nr:tRNA (adenosine(37)-N6)-threonylcarbamoyltransferase complex ATPase subunit type 1 TsaE [Patescibacteria group bacterium]